MVDYRRTVVKVLKGFRFRLQFASCIAIPIGMLALSSVAAYSQVLYGSIVGNVTDSSGAVIPGAQITATLISTNEVRTAVTNESGVYTLANLPSGLYRIAVNMSGFQAYKADNLTVTVNATSRFDAKLTVGASSETINVNAEAAQLQTDRSDVNTQVASQEFVDIPQPTRTYEGLLGTVPGMAPPTYNALKTNNVDRGMQLQANGSSTSSTDVRIEGVSAAQGWTPYNSSLVPSVEAIETVNVVTGSADASQTLANGATINVQLKSGTNQFHGSAYEYHIDNLWAARPYFQRTGALPKATDNNFGGTIGGRILRDKLFFFTSYEGDWLGQSSVVNLTVPTPAMLSGDFSAGGNCNTTNASSAPACTILYDPASGDPSTGAGKKTFLAETGKNAIPTSRISNQVKPLLDLFSQFPASATPPLSTSTPYLNNLQVVIQKPQVLQKSDTKIDWDVNKKLRIVGRFNDHPYSAGFPSSGPGTLFNTAISAHSYGNTAASTVAATYIARADLLIDGAWGFTRSVQTIDPPYGNVKYGASTLGIPGVNIDPLPVGGGIPNFNFITGGYTSLGYQYSYLHYADPIFSYSGNVTYTKKSNTFKFGGLLNQVHLNHIEPPGLVGTPDGFSFLGNATTSLEAQSGNSGQPKGSSQFNSFADFLLGLPSSWQAASQPKGATKLNMLQISFYATNTQQLGPKTTVNYGTSWAYFPTPSRGGYGIENFNFNTNTYQVCGFGGIPKSCGIKSSWALLGPHLGISHRINESFVIRAGASIAPEQYNMYRNSLYNYPETLAYSASAANSFVPVGSLASGVPTLQQPDITQGILPLKANTLFDALPQKIVRGYTESWNLAVEKEFGPWLMQVAYVGNNAVHIHNLYNFNYGQLGQGIQSGFMYKYNGTTAAETVTLPLGHTNYNSLQATAQRRFKNGYQLRASYTLSKWMGLCCDTNGFIGLQTAIPQYIRYNYTVMPGDRRNNLTITGVIESPFGKNKQFLQNGFAGLVLGGWQLNGSETIYSGQPVNILEPASVDPVFNAPGSLQRPDQVKARVGINPQNITQYFDTSAFAAVHNTSASTVRFGTSAYNPIYGPGAANLDASIFRSFTYRERYKAQFRIEAFNVTNTPHFGQPGANIGTSSFGQITATAALSRATDSRYFRFGAKILF